MLECLNSIRVNNKLVISLLIATSIFTYGAKSKSIPRIEEGRLQVDGIEIYYKIMGEGPPTFILHGGPGYGHDHMLQLKDLADQFKLIFYDQRAAGRSTGDSDTLSHTIKTFVEDLEQLRLKLAPEKINVIGASWGAMLAMQYAFKYSKNINALVLLGSMGATSEFIEPFGTNLKNN